MRIQSGGTGAAATKLNGQRRYEGGIDPLRHAGAAIPVHTKSFCCSASFSVLIRAVDRPERHPNAFRGGGGVRGAPLHYCCFTARSRTGNIPRAGPHTWVSLNIYAPGCPSSIFNDSHPSSHRIPTTGTKMFCTIGTDRECVFTGWIEPQFLEKAVTDGTVVHAHPIRRHGGRRYEVDWSARY